MKQIPIALLTRPMEGGMKKHVLQLIKGLNRAWFSIHLLGPTSFAKETNGELASYFPLELQESLNPMKKISQIITLYHYLRRNRIQLLHCHGIQASLIGRPAAWLAKTPAIICTFHNLVYDRPYTYWRKEIYSLGNRLLNHKTDYFIAVSEALKRHLIEREKINSNKIATIYNGLEPNEYDSVVWKPLLESSPKGPVVGMIGRLVPEKGVDLFLECTAIIGRRKSNAHFLIVGDGPERPLLEKRAKELGVEAKVRFLGFREDVPLIMKSIDVIVVPSRSEGLSIVTLEAMALGKPVVAFSVGALPEVIVPGETGLLIPALNITALAEGIITLLQNKSYAEYLGRNGLARVCELFSVKRMIEETEAVYLKVLADSNVFLSEV